jgi:hypothetical protein
MSSDIETAFAAIRWQHLRTVEALHAVVQRNEDLERAAQSYSQSMGAEKNKIDALKGGIKNMFRWFRGELEVCRSLIAKQSTSCYNDCSKIVGALMLKSEALTKDKANLVYKLGDTQREVQRLQARLLQFEKESADDLKGALCCLLSPVSCAVPGPALHWQCWRIIR